MSSNYKPSDNNTNMIIWLKLPCRFWILGSSLKSWIRDTFWLNSVRPNRSEIRIYHEILIWKPKLRSGPLSWAETEIQWLNSYEFWVHHVVNIVNVSNLRQWNLTNAVNNTNHWIVTANLSIVVGNQTLSCAQLTGNGIYGVSKIGRICDTI